MFTEKLWDFSTTNYSTKKALWCAQLSLHAYDTIDTFNTYFDDVTFFDNEGAQAYGIEHNGIVFLAFRGTETSEASDLVADSKSWKVTSHFGGSVHVGFKEELEKIWEPITEWLIEHKDKQIYVTGHSLGAAMATLATSRLPHGTKCYNFGSPRVGSEEFATEFDSKYELHRFVNNNDIVCTIPPSIIGFQHVGTLHYINTYGQLRNLTGWQKTKDKFRGYYHSWSNGEAFDNFRDHGMEFYEDNIGRNC